MFKASLVSLLLLVSPGPWVTAQRVLGGHTVASVNLPRDQKVVWFCVEMKSEDEPDWVPRHCGFPEDATHDIWENWPPEGETWEVGGFIQVQDTPDQMNNFRVIRMPWSPIQ